MYPSPIKDFTFVTYTLCYANTCNSNASFNIYVYINLHTYYIPWHLLYTTHAHTYKNNMIYAYINKKHPAVDTTRLNYFYE